MSAAAEVLSELEKQGFSGEEIIEAIDATDTTDAKTLTNAMICEFKYSFYYHITEFILSYVWANYFTINILNFTASREAVSRGDKDGKENQSVFPFGYIESGKKYLLL